ncbi:MAG TPA: hypothetical protein VIC26_12200 [Marinagarivorans sp.]
MSFFKRIQATLTGGLDQAISQLENQDAVVDAILKEARQAVAKAKVRLARVQRDEQLMAREQAELEAAILTWTERAKRTGQTDEAKAIECLRQRRLCVERKDALVARLEQHRRVGKSLAADVALAEARVKEMLNKQHLMRTRESAADAMRGIGSVERNMDDELSATFERWEIKVSETELLGGSYVHSTEVEAFEQAFISQEEELALRQELAELNSVPSAQGENRHE